MPHGSQPAAMSHQDRAQVYPLESLQAMALAGRYRSQHFSPHAHDTYAVGLIEAGTLVFECERRTFSAQAGAICLINPGDMHTGRAGCREGWRYWNAYLPASLISDINGRAARFGTAVVNDTTCFRALSRFFAAVKRRKEPLHVESLLFEALLLLLARHAEYNQVVTRHSNSLVSLAQDFMEENLERQIGLADLANITGVTSFHLARQFKAQIGLSPHAWLVQRRAERARGLILSGVGLAEAAAAAGFSDQPHLTRWLKRVLGVTPGQLIRSSTFKTQAAEAARLRF